MSRALFILLSFILYLTPHYENLPPNVFYSKTGIKITAPEWLSESSYGELDRTINAYISIYEKHFNREINRKLIHITIVNTKDFLIPGEGNLVGYFRSENRFPDYSRHQIMLVWRRNSQNIPMINNPFYTFIHELIHFTQYVDDGKAPHHDFTLKEKMAAETDLLGKYVVFNVPEQK